MITLGIIGVVAALTLPTLVDSYYKQIAEARLKKFYSVFNQAILLAEAKYGPKESWYKDVSGVEFDDEGNAITETNEVDKWFSKYLEDFMVIKKKSLNNGIMIYWLNDGSQFRLAGYNGADQLYSVRDISFYPFGNFEQCVEKPQDGTQCSFLFNFAPVANRQIPSQIKYLLNKGLEPYLTYWDGNYDTLWTHTRYGCKSGNSTGGQYCTAIIQRNGWKIPKNYPFKVHP